MDIILDRAKAFDSFDVTEGKRTKNEKIGGKIPKKSCRRQFEFFVFSSVLPVMPKNVNGIIFVEFLMVIGEIML